MPRATLLIRLLPAAFLIFSLFGTSPIPSAAKQDSGETMRVAAYDPSLMVWLNRSDMDVEGNDWTIGDSITLTVNDPGTAPSPDYTTSAIAGPAPWDATSGRVTYLLDGILEFEPGFNVTLGDGTTTKTLVLPLLQVTGVDPILDKVSGIATAGASVIISPYDSSARRYATANSLGNWEVDFSIPGSQPDESTLFDIQGGTSGNATIQDTDRDGIAYEWALPDPSFYVWFENWGNPNNGIHFDVHGYQWPMNTPVTLTIDRLDTTGSPDYTRTATMEVPEWGGKPQLVFDTVGLVVRTGDLFHMTDGTFTVNHSITSLAVSRFDVDADTASGTAAPGSVVDLVLKDTNVYRHVTAGLDGIWLADFSDPGPGPDEADTVDLVPGLRFIISQNNPDNPKATNAYGGIEIPAPIIPYIEARPGPDWIRAWNWPASTQLTLLVNDPNTPQPVDYSDTGLAVNEDPCGDPNCTIAFFDLGEFDLKPGHIISIMAGAEVKSYTVATFRVEDVNYADDTIEGSGEPGHFLQVCVYGESSNACRWVTVDGDGFWSVDFHNPGANSGEERTADLQPGSTGWITDTEEDGDVTNRGWMTFIELYLPCVIRE